MKLAIALFAVALSTSAVFAGDLLQLKSGKVITAPDLKSPLGPEWTVAKGKWEPADGVLKSTEIPAEKHSAVLWLKTGPTPIVFECEFRFGSAKVFYIGCDAASHVGRLVLVPKKAQLAHDSPENPVGANGKRTSATITEKAIDLKPDEWQKVRVEFTGDQLAARLNDVEMKAQHPYLATPKQRWWFAAGGGTAEIRNIHVSEGEPAK
jgi:hypothetical protein